MAHYMISYFGGEKPSSSEQDQQQMTKYMGWLASLGDSAISPANPLSNSKTIHSDGRVTESSQSSMSGYTLIEADSMDAALAIAQACPFLEIGGTLELAEVIAMPS